MQIVSTNLEGQIKEQQKALLISQSQTKMLITLIITARLRKFGS